MSPRERMATAMRIGIPDRVPVMCQLSIGHLFLHSGVDPVDIWFSSEAFAEALVRMQRHYGFDGILVNLPGRPPDVLERARWIDRGPDSATIHWRDGSRTILPFDDLPHHHPQADSRPHPSFDALDPDTLYYTELWDVTAPSYPFHWAFDSTPADPAAFFPDYVDRAIRAVREAAGFSISVHAEVFSPWSQMLEMLGIERSLLALIDDAPKMHACLERLSLGASELALRHVASGADAVLISSAFAGAGFISRRHYAEFVLPYERRIVETTRAASDVPVYTHTCGAIGDRLDLMLQTGTRGIDTLDPPPLGTVDLEDAVRKIGGDAFIKGNLDPVHVLLPGPIERIRTDAAHRVEVGMPGGGYILSTACSVAPHTPPEHVGVLREIVDATGYYS